MESVKCTFKYAFIGIVVFLVLLYGFYRYTFNGYLSYEISEWTAFVLIFAVIGGLLEIRTREKYGEAAGKAIQREAFDIYMKALHLEMKIGEAMNAK